jgi:hypothetical protein
MRLEMIFACAEGSIENRNIKPPCIQRDSTIGMSIRGDHVAGSNIYTNISHNYQDQPRMLQGIHRLAFPLPASSTYDNDLQNYQ